MEISIHEFLERMGSSMAEMAEAQEMIEREGEMPVLESIRRAREAQQRHTQRHNVQMEIPYGG